jgi:hypothetical protein
MGSTSTSKMLTAEFLYISKIYIRTAILNIFRVLKYYICLNNLHIYFIFTFGLRTYGYSRIHFKIVVELTDSNRFDIDTGLNRFVIDPI